MKEAWQIQFENILDQRFQEIKKRNRRFSLRTFAKSANISPTSMSFILNRAPNWSLSLERAIESLEHLRVTQEKIDHFKVVASNKLSDSAAKLTEVDQNSLLTSPHYIPVLLAHGLNERPTPKLLAEKLGVDELEILSIIENLVTMGHLEKAQGKVVLPATSDKLKTQDGPSNEVIRQHHAANIDVIRHSLLHDPADARDVTSLTFTGDASQIEEVKKEIRQFYQRVHAIMNHSEKKNEIFKMVVGFKPLNINDGVSEAL